MSNFLPLGPLTRRDVLRRSALGLGSLGLAGVLADDARLIADEASAAGPLAVRARVHSPSALRIFRARRNG
jgi:hypothetical protein